MKSVRNTRKITKAMEMVATAKMRKATERAAAGRPYVQSLVDVFFHVEERASASQLANWLTGKEGATRELLVLFMSDRGLCGGYNAQMVKLVRGWAREREREVIDVVAVGKRATQAAKRLGLNVVASFADVGAVRGETNPMRAPLRFALDGFSHGTYRRVWLAYTDFISTVTQVPRCGELLPLQSSLLDDWRRGAERSAISDGTLFEPSPEVVLERVVPPLVQALGLQAFLEAQASEHAARMMAMRNATDAASEVLQNLTRLYNQARQAAITQEIAEISGGKAALE